MGNSHTCARLGDGTARCWGWNFQGELGDGTRIQRTSPVVVGGLSGVTEITAGANISCALTTDRSVQCWGANGQGGLGNGGNTQSSTPTPIALTLATAR